MRTTIVMLGCLFASAAFAAEQMEKSTEAKAKPIVVAKATKRQAAQPAKTEGPGRVWTVEMSCCEPQ